MQKLFLKVLLPLWVFVVSSTRELVTLPPPVGRKLRSLPSLRESQFSGLPAPGPNCWDLAFLLAPGRCSGAEGWRSVQLRKTRACGIRKEGGEAEGRECKRDKDGIRKSRHRMILFNRASVTLGMSLHWVVTAAVVVPVLQVSLLRFRVTDLTPTANEGSHRFQKRLTALLWSP